MPRNPRADQIGTGGRIKSESPGGCARNAHMVVENAGFPFNEDVIEPQTVVPAMIESFHSSNDALVKLIEKITAT